MDKAIDMMLGLVKSFTAWLGLIVIAFPDWWPLVSDNVAALFGDVSKDNIIRAMGILVVLVRFKTNQSLTDKGKGV